MLKVTLMTWSMTKLQYINAYCEQSMIMYNLFSRRIWWEVETQWTRNQTNKSKNKAV